MMVYELKETAAVVVLFSVTNKTYFNGDRYFPIGEILKIKNNIFQFLSYLYL